MEETLERKIREALTLAYNTPENEKKVMDFTLLEAMVKELVKILT